MTSRRNDKSLIAIAVGVLVTVALFFIGYSYKTSDKMGRTTITTGSSTIPEKAEDKPANVITNSTRPPATSTTR